MDGVGAGGTDGIERDGWMALGAGVALAAVVHALPLLAFVLSYFGVLAHELGHALFGWLYGYPSVPAFDFAYGGGVTQQMQRMGLLVVLVQAGLVWLVWLFWRNSLSRALAIALAAGYALSAWTSLHQPVITAMGHGFELFIAGLFLHRALSGRACHHEGERAAYAFVGAFLTLHNLRFAWGLVTSPLERHLYQEAKGGGHWMDFSVLAEQHLHVPLQLVAAVYLCLCLAPPLVAWIVNHRGGATARVVDRLRRLD